jgi:hypothetical protein
MLRLPVFTLVVLSLSSCASRKVSRVERPTVEVAPVPILKSDAHGFDPHVAQHQEASLIDVPIPLYTHRLPIIANNHCGSQIVLGYRSFVEPSSLVELYQSQMELQGWNLARSFIGSETLLHFEKPTRACSISVRPHISFFGTPSGTDLVIYVEDSKFSW